LLKISVTAQHSTERYGDAPKAVIAIYEEIKLKSRI
jgi:hypothetical protein